MVKSRQDREIPSRYQRYFRITLVLVIILSLNAAGTWLARQINFQLFPRHMAMLDAILLAAVVIYILFMATPFMPGIEVGLAIMFLLGSKSALLVYLCTLIALSISYAIGKIFPLHWVRKFLQWLYLNRASRLVDQLEKLAPGERLQFLYRQSPAKLAPFLLNHRYATIAVALNLPGNALIGGGGGIGLIVGMSRLIPFHKYFLLISLAIAPVPLFIYVQGM